MITIEKELSLPDTYPLKRLGELQDILFFDIETTGFSGDSSTLYLIGCIYKQASTWHFCQWFADSTEAEAQVLIEFFNLLKQFKILVHFNGDGFDIPYLSKRCAAHKLPYDFSQIQSVDIFKKIRPYRSLLGLDSLKQKSIESFLGVSRKDTFSGGQLIQVYEEYLMTREDYLLHLLLLHNEDDLKGMPSILPILSYPDFFESQFVLGRQLVTCLTDIFGDQKRRLSLLCQSDISLPVPIEFEKDFLSLSAEENQIELQIDLYEGTLKYYYPNYKDYYYLIYEDTAIHRSVAEFVDKEARKKATADTCYAKKEGCYLPQCKTLWEPALKLGRRDKISYVEYSETLLADPLRFQAYIGQLLDLVWGKIKL